VIGIPYRVNTIRKTTISIIDIIVYIWLDVYPTCHAILQAGMDTDPLENNRYAIDPDAAGGVPMFGVTCDFDTKPGVGATIVCYKMSCV